MRRPWAIGAAALTVAAMAAATSAAAGQGGQPIRAAQQDPAPDEFDRLVPDLVSITPGTVQTARRMSRDRGRRVLLTFSSSVVNHGAGPLELSALRHPGESRLRANQFAYKPDGSTAPVGRQGFLRFVRGGGHSHWHVEDFMRYELRTLDGRSLRRDRKTGFCLGDRYDATGPERLAREPASPFYRGRCGLDRPNISSLVQGISVGYGDDYPARLEGQFIDITGLRTGRYTLVLRVDPTEMLYDQHRDNNVASMLVKIVRSPNSARARIQAWCPGTATCAAPGAPARGR